MTQMQELQKIFNEKGEMLGVFISCELWEQVKDQLEPKSQVRPELKEPTSDWEMLCDYWDFQYPIATDVHCELCGNHTDDWQTDNPRKFRLKAANMGGLVVFECCNCHGRITKKHFKDKISCSCSASPSCQEG